jgi:hypothetical protein
MPFIRGEIEKDEIGSRSFGSEAEGFVPVVHAFVLPSKENPMRLKICSVDSRNVAASFCRSQQVQRSFSYRAETVSFDMKPSGNASSARFSIIRTTCPRLTTALVDQ